MAGLENSNVDGIEIKTTYFTNWKSTSFTKGDLSADLTHPDTTNDKSYYSANLYKDGKSRTLVKRLGNYATPEDVERSKNTKGVSGYPLHRNDDFKDMSPDEIIMKVVNELNKLQIN